MTYLIVQIMVALGLAAICGGAIGWIVHRANYSGQLDNLRHALARQQNQLAQAQSEIGMLTDDYEDLQRRSQDEIEALREDNQQIPALNTNLEKSQLLVRQMMQKHEAKVRDLTAENQSLKGKLKSIDDREQAHNTVQAELDRVRRKKQEAADSDAADGSVAAHAHPGDAVADPDAAQSQQDDAPGVASTAADAAITDDNKASPNDASTRDTQVPEADSLNATDKTLDKTTDTEPSESPSSSSVARSSGSWASASVAPSAMADTEDTPSTEHSVNTASVNTDAEESEGARADDSDADPFDHVMEVGDELQRELDIDAGNDPMLDGSGDASSLFEPVEQRDDLKQIFGIGPVTEKALNQLGITSYSQLADLKEHEIEKIADVLQIVPGRIERDDWVGNARRQLEDVLEEL